MSRAPPGGSGALQSWGSATWPSRPIGSLTLDNFSGQFHRLNPADWVDPHQGVRIVISWPGFTFFTGWSGGFIQTALDTGLNTVTVPLLGAFAWYARFNTDLYARLTGEGEFGELLTGTAINELLDAVGVDRVTTPGRYPSVPRLVDPGTQQILAHRLNTSGLLGAGNERADFQAAFKACILTELGYGYDNRLGQIVAEDFRNRVARRQSVDIVIPTTSATPVVTGGEPAKLVKNSITTRTGTFKRVGDDDGEPIAFDPPLPLALTVPPGGTKVILRVQDYSTTGGGKVEFRAGLAAAGSRH